MCLILLRLIKQYREKKVVSQFFAHEIQNPFFRDMHKKRCVASHRLIHFLRRLSSKSPSSAPVGLSLCGGGFLGAFHIGAWQGLCEHFPNWTASGPAIAGSSAGSVVGASICSDMCKDQMLESLGRISEKVRSFPFKALTPGADLAGIMAQELRRSLPEDAHERCSGRLFIGVTTFPDKKKWPPRFRLVNDFRSREHLIECVRISSYLPGITAPLAALPCLDGIAAIDGGFSRNWPRLPLPEASDEYGNKAKGYHTLHVSAFSGPDFPIAPLPLSTSGSSFDISLSAQNVRLTAHTGLLEQLYDIIMPPDDSKLNKLIKSGSDAVGRFAALAENRPLTEIRSLLELRDNELASLKFEAHGTKR